MKVHVHGNCQSFIISEMLKEACPSWDITFYEVHAAPIMQNLANYRTLIATADIVLSQPIHDGYRSVAELSLTWVRDHVKPGATLVVIPALHFSGHHPEFANLTKLGNLCQNVLAGHLSMMDISPEQSVDLLLSENLFDDAFIRTEIDLQLAEMRRREERDRFDVSISDIIVQEAIYLQMFHIINHPNRVLCAYLVNRILQRLDIPERTSLLGRDYMSNPHVPACPTIARFCSRRRSTVSDQEPPESRVLVPNRAPMQVTDYLSEMMKQFGRQTPQTIMAAIKADWRAVEFLKRLANAGSNVPGISVWRSG